MNKSAIFAKVSGLTQFSKKDIGKIWDAGLEVISDALKSGEDVILKGFGSFKVVSRGEQVVSSPLLTKGKCVVPPRNHVKFRAGAPIRRHYKDLSLKGKIYGR